MSKVELERLQAQTLSRQVHAVIEMAEIPLPLAEASLAGIMIALRKARGGRWEAVSGDLHAAWILTDALDAVGAAAGGEPRT